MPVAHDAVPGEKETTQDSSYSIQLLGANEAVTHSTGNTHLRQRDILHRCCPAMHSGHSFSDLPYLTQYDVGEATSPLLVRHEWKQQSLVIHNCVS